MRQHDIFKLPTTTKTIKNNYKNQKTLETTRNHQKLLVNHQTHWKTLWPIIDYWKPRKWQFDQRKNHTWGDGDSLTWKYKSYQNVHFMLFDRYEIHVPALENVFTGMFILFWCPSSTFQPFVISRIHNFKIQNLKNEMRKKTESWNCLILFSVN